jgi:DNA-binding MarR family transcriptional regulator
LSNLSREELIEAFVAAVRASQTATEMLDQAVADHFGLDRNAYRCLDILDQEGPMTAGLLAKRSRLSPGAITALLDRLEEKGLARRVRDTKDRRRVLVEVAPKLREMAEQLYGPPGEAAQGLSGYTDEQLELLIGFLRGSAAYQQMLMQRLDALPAPEAQAAEVPSQPTQDERSASTTP